MTGFSTEWLSLREAADHRARSGETADALSARFAQRSAISVVDIGCGTGSNLRATAPLLPEHQKWRLIDHDPDLLAAAREHLAQWADKMTIDGDRLMLEAQGKHIEVEVHQCDLNGDLSDALGPDANLITAAAFFDLASVPFIQRLAAAVVARKAVFHAVLTYNGRQLWSPKHPSDNAVTAAFHRHQMRDKGLGVAAGPTAAMELADQFRANGYSVMEGESPWQLGAGDAALIAELQAGHARAVAETGAVDQKTLERWTALKRSGAYIGHTDTLAMPPW